MTEIKNFFKSHLKELMGILGMLLIYCIFFPAVFQHHGDFLIDCGREAYLPSQVLQGKVLYKDIFNIYGPFAYQFNAFLYRILGENLNILYYSGIGCSFLILISSYLISRSIASPLTAWIISFFVLNIGLFNHWFSSFIFPYSYSTLYALVALLFSVLCYVYFLKFDNEKLFLISTFFAGLSLTSKYDYIFYVFFLILSALFIKPIAKKNLFFSGLTFLIAPIISFGILFAQGLTFQELFKNTMLIKKMASTSSLKFFYTSAGVFFNQTIVLESLKSFFLYFKNIFLSSALIYTLILFSNNKFQPYIKFRIPKALTVLILVMSFFLFPKDLLISLCLKRSYSWISMIIALAVVIFGAISFKKNSFKNKLSQGQILFLLAVISLLSGIKSFFSVNFLVYGIFSFVLFFMVFAIFLMEKTPQYFQKIDKNAWKLTFFTIFLFMGFIFIFQESYLETNIKSFPVQTAKGVLYSNKWKGSVYQEVIDYVKTHTPKNSSILSIPEGEMINFLTDRPSNNFYYNLLPLYVEMYGEKNIINGLKQEMPDYIFVNNRKTSEYGKALICKDYAYGLCNFISQNYELEKVFLIKRKDKTFATNLFKKTHP